MTMDKAAIIQQIDRLDHPDAHLQDTILAKFSARPGKVRPVVLANFPLVNDRIRRALLRWLSRHMTSEATLPLMRYVFDERTTIDEQVGRAMAMGLLLKRARRTDLPEERGRLRGFAEDICTGEDSPEIRRLGLRILAFTGNQRSISVVEDALRDEDEDVREAAHQAMDALQEAPEDSGSTPKSAFDLSKALSDSAGPRRRQLIRQWKRHDEAPEIAVGLLREKSDLRSEALQILLDDPTNKARPFLASIIFDKPDSGRAALALRLLAKIGEPGSAGPDEIEAIRRSLRSISVLNQSAACAAVGALGLVQFARDLVEMSLSRDLSLSLAASAGLDDIVSESDTDLIRHLTQAIEINDRRRRESRNAADPIRVVAHLQSALRKIVTPNTLGVEAIHQLALTQLERAGRHRPIAVTALQLLMASTPKEGISEAERWSIREAAALLNLLPYADQASARRIAALLFRGAPEGLADLDRSARDLRKSGFVDVAEVVVPLLQRSGSERAKKTLQEIADGEDVEAVSAARQALRKMRNDGQVIDAEFVPRDE